MIFDEIVVHNFGPFSGRHAITLSPGAKSQPVVLLGGLNGAGKTTLLDAINLALYGKRARCSKRGTKAYDDFLLGSIHKGSPVHEGAGVELAFRRYEGGLLTRYRVRRTWSGATATIRERVEVVRNDVLDEFLTDSWNEQVEEFIPSGVADLFLFDGEKIEQLADIDNSHSVLQTAMQSLLGLGVVEQLENDLTVLERRKRMTTQSTEEQARVAALEVEIDQTKARRSAVNEAEAATRVEVESAKRMLEKVEEKLRKSGGDLFVKRGETERTLAVARNKAGSYESNLRDQAAGALPLALVRDQLVDLAGNGATDAADLLAAFQKRDAEILNILPSLGLTKDLLAKIQAALQIDRERRQDQTSMARGSTVPRDTRVRMRMLVDEILPGDEDLLARTLEDLRAAQEDVATQERFLAATPHKESIESLFADRERARVALEVAETRLHALSEEFTTLTRLLDGAASKLARELESRAEILNEQEDDERTVDASRKTREVLKSFRVAMLAKHSERLSRLVMESLRQLLRKEGLVDDLRIDPETLSVRLFDAGGSELNPDRLSAGERQLLAVSLLWGLAQASGRPLPTVIDTPMGRLDSTHRERLIERYFPRASHQVLLLSTDEEIRGGYLDKISKYVGRSYRIVHDPKQRRSNVVDGYFW